MGLRVRAKASAWLCTAAFLLGTAPGALGAAATSGNDVPSFVAVTPPAAYHIEKVGTQGIKLTSKSSTNSYAITVLGSSGQASNAQPGLGEVWQKSLGVEVQGKLGSYVKTDLTTRFTELEGAADPGPFGMSATGTPGMDKRALEEFSFSTKFLGDRVSITSSRRASDHVALDTALDGRQGVYAQDKFNAWVWRSPTSSFSVEGTSSRVDSGFQNLSQAMQTKNEENQQLKSKFSYGRAGIFVGQRESMALAPDRVTTLSRQSDIETGASLGLSDLRTGGVIRELLPDSVWASTSRGSAVGYGGEATSESRPLEKSAVGLTRSFDGGSVNMSYWRSQIASPVSDESQWRGHGMDIGGTLKSGHLSVSGNLSVYSADNVAMAANTAESNVNGSLFLTWSRAAWPKLSAGVTNYAYQSSFFDYGGLEQAKLMRYELAVDSTPLVSAWVDPQAQLKFIASYQDNSYRSQWAQSGDTSGAAQNMFFGFKFSRSLLP